MANPDLDAWFDTPRGQYLLAWEQRRYDLAVADIFGFNAVQIGLARVDLLAHNRMPYRCHCATATGTGGPIDLRFDGCELPFAAQSVDLVLLPHVLEFAASPHQLLREVERVLVPEGSVIISGFNPYSLWGLRRAVAGNLGSMPWRGQYLSVSRLKDWLALLGFEMRATAFGCYAPPVASQAWLQRWSFMEAAGSRCWSFAGGAYMLQAVKRVHGMRLVLPRWREAALRKKGMLTVTQSGGQKVGQ